MFIQMSREEMTLVQGSLNMHETRPEARQLANRLGEILAQDPEMATRFQEAAKDNYLVYLSDGDLDFDDTSEATISQSDEGAYVLAWLWVSNQDAEFTCDDEEETSE